MFIMHWEKWKEIMRLFAYSGLKNKESWVPLGMLPQYLESCRIISTGPRLKGHGYCLFWPVIDYW